MNPPRSVRSFRRCWASERRRRRSAGGPPASARRYEPATFPAIAAEDQRRLADERRQAILESLAAIGYEIDGTPMETAVVRAGKLVIRKPGNAEYAVEMGVNPEFSLLQTAMVRHADNADLTEQQRLRDCEQEESWCGDRARLREELARHGFNSAFKLRLPSGQHPLRVIVRSPAERARQHAGRSESRL